MQAASEKLVWLKHIETSLVVVQQSCQRELGACLARARDCGTVITHALAHTLEQISGNYAQSLLYENLNLIDDTVKREFMRIRGRLTEMRAGSHSNQEYFNYCCATLSAAKENH